MSTPGLQQEAGSAPEVVRVGPRYGTRCLADLVPVTRGTDVLVAGRTRDLVAYLHHLGVEPTAVRAPRGRHAWSIPAPEASQDVVIVAKACRRHESVPVEAARVLRSGGWLVLGARHRDWGRGRPNARTVSRARSALLGAGFDEVEVHGVRSSLRAPRFVVPLEDPRVVRWFLRTAFLAETTLGALAVRALAVLPGSAASGLLFRDLLLVARRHERP